MTPPPALTVQNVWKRYSHDVRKGSWRTLGRSLGLPQSAALAPDEFWALQDISFSVEPGEVIALLGRNGSGKSTLIKLLAGIYQSDQGSITTNGIVRLQQVMSGYAPLLTGTEFVYLTASLYGMSSTEVDRLLPPIIAFAELHDSMDDPMQNYSQGMRMRLGMAVAVHTECDILLLDEVLLGGDIGFREKCQVHLQSLKDRGDRTVVIATHTPGVVRQLASRALVLSEGTLVFDGEIEAGIERYKEQCSPSAKTV